MYPLKIETHIDSAQMDKTGGQVTTVCQFWSKTLAVLKVNFGSQFANADRPVRRTTAFAEFCGSILHQNWTVGRYTEISRLGRLKTHGHADAAEIFETLREDLPKIVDISGGLTLATYDAETQTLSYHSTHEFKGAYPFQGPCTYVIRHFEDSGNEEMSEIHVMDLLLESESLQFDLFDVANHGDNSPRSLLFLPLTLRDDPVGVLSIQSLQANAFDDEDLRILRLIGNNIGFALGNIRLSRDNPNLRDFEQRVMDDFDERTSLKNVVKSIRAATDASIVHLYPYSSVSGVFELPPYRDGPFHDAYSPDSLEAKYDDFAMLAINRGEPLFASTSDQLDQVLGGISGERQANFEKRGKELSIAAIPLQVAGEQIGVLFVSYRVSQRFEPPQKRLLESLGTFAASAIKADRDYRAVRPDIQHIASTLRAQRDKIELALRSGNDARTDRTLDYLRKGQFSKYRLGGLPPIRIPTLSGATSDIFISGWAHFAGSTNTEVISARGGRKTRTQRKGGDKGKSVGVPRTATQSISHVIAKQSDVQMAAVWAVAKLSLEEDNIAFVGRTYSVSTGLAEKPPVGYVSGPVEYPTSPKSSVMMIEIVFHEGANIRLSTDWQLHLAYEFSNHEPQLITFLFQTITTGDSSFTIDFFHERRWLRSFRFDFKSLQLPELASDAA